MSRLDTQLFQTRPPAGQVSSADTQEEDTEVDDVFSRAFQEQVTISKFLFFILPLFSLSSRFIEVKTGQTLLLCWLSIPQRPLITSRPSPLLMPMTQPPPYLSILANR